jgi:hypothetical protein
LPRSSGRVTHGLYSINEPKPKVLSFGEDLGEASTT